jgi:hypothetical protein
MFGFPSQFKLGQHVHSAQTPEEKNFWDSLSDSVNAESVLVQVLV